MIGGFDEIFGGLILIAIIIAIFWLFMRWLCRWVDEVATKGSETYMDIKDEDY